MKDDVVQVNDRDVWVLALAFLMMALTIGVVVVNFVLLAGWAKDAAETHAAACSYLQNLESQAHSSRQFLAKHPSGLPQLGISAGQIQSGIDKENAAVASLSGLNCN